jgi:hypothetical protein
LGFAFAAARASPKGIALVFGFFCLPAFWLPESHCSRIAVAVLGDGKFAVSLFGDW